MTRLEVVALFSALDRLLEKEDVEGAKKVVAKVLKEAERNDKTNL